MLLTHYNPEVPTVITAFPINYDVEVTPRIFPDGSEKLVAYASQSLISAENNGKQIEKEAITIAYAMMKIYKFIYGFHFTLLTDHKP